MSDPGDSLVGSSKPSPLRTVAVVVAIGGVLGAGAWLLTRDKGQPEDPARVLIVGTNPGLTSFIERAGFDPDYLSVGQAIGEGQVFDRSLDDLPAMLEYADQRGYGYLALDMAHGETYDFSTIDYEAEPPPPGTTFAVVSVGKLGKTVSFGGVVANVTHEPPSGEQIGLLLALFEQPDIARARTQDASNDLMIRFGSARTVEDVIEYEEGQEHMRRQIEAWAQLRERERGATKPIELAGPYELLRGWPLANGAVLLASGRDAWRSQDGRSSTWSGEELDATFSVVTLDAPNTRMACEALPDSLAIDGGFAVAPAGDALLIPRDRGVADLWVLTGEGCGFELRDQIRRLEQGELGIPRASGRTAAIRTGRLMWADAKMRAFRALRLDGVTAHDDTLRWVDDETVVMSATLDFMTAATLRAKRMAAAAAEAEGAEAGPAAELPDIDPTQLPGPREALIFVKLPPPSQSDSMQVAVLPIDAWVAGDLTTLSIRDVFALADTRAVIVRVDTPEGSRLIRVARPGEAAWADGLAVDYDLARALELDRGKPETAVLASNLPTDIHDLDIAPDGRHAAWSAPFGETARDTPLTNVEIVVLPLGVDAQPLRLTDNDRSDARPRFVGAAHLVFDSGYTAASDLPRVEALRGLEL